MQKPPIEPPILLTRRQVARLLAVSENTVVNLEKDGELKPIRLRGSVRHCRQAIERKIQELAIAG